MRPEDFLALAIKPALERIELYSPAAAQLLLATAIQESRLVYRKQIGGPALSYFQIEPNTHFDIWENFLKFRHKLGSRILALLPSESADKLEQLEENDEYAAAIARVHYLRVPKPLPEYDDIHGMAAYWKRYYNTELGRGTEEEFVRNWKRALERS